MNNNQLGKRNLTELQKSALRGKKFNERKKTHGGDRNIQDAKLTSCDNSKTSEVIAKEENVSPRTINRDGDFATGLSKATPELEAKILSKEVKVNKLWHE